MKSNEMIEIGPRDLTCMQYCCYGFDNTRRIS